MILFVDGYDVLLTPAVREVPRLFSERFNAPVVFSTEFACSPRRRFEHRFRSPLPGKARRGEAGWGRGRGRGRRRSRGHDDEFELRRFCGQCCQSAGDATRCFRRRLRPIPIPIPNHISNHIPNHTLLRMRRHIGHVRCLRHVWADGSTGLLAIRPRPSRLHRA